MAKRILFKPRVEATKQMTQNWKLRDRFLLQVTGHRSTKPGNTSTTAIQATPASVFVQHNQLSVNLNSMASFAHGDRGQRSPPHFNFYKCTNVHIHNNFGPSSRISFVNILGVSFQLFCDVNFINLTFFD